MKESLLAQALPPLGMSMCGRIGKRDQWEHTMARRSILAKQKKVGRPRTGITPMVGVRISDETRSRIERWAAKQTGKPGLSEAVRRLVEIGLAGAKPVRRFISKVAGAKAKQMAGREIDQMVDKSAPPDVQAKRKRRLLKGPSEFREMRKD